MFPRSFNTPNAPNLSPDTAEPPSLFGRKKQDFENVTPQDFPRTWDMLLSRTFCTNT
jgi:hypothetical protein